MPKRTSLPSMLPPGCAALAALVDAERARDAGCRAARPTTHDARAARRRSTVIAASTAQPWRRSPTIAPNVKQSAAGISRIASISRKLESGVGFSNGCAELTLKKPPPLVPSCLIAICDAAGPTARSALALGDRLALPS